MEKICYVSIVGRPNVGKSTLFNRFVKKRLSIVDDMAGTTRDRIYSRVSFGDKEIYLTDTGGIKFNDSGSIDYLVDREVVKAIVESDPIIFLCDNEGVTELEYRLAEDLRRKGKKVVLAVNKIDSPSLMPPIRDYFRLGFGEPVFISASHGINVDILSDRIYELLPEETKLPPVDYLFKLALLGEPNTGKSTLLNNLSGKERAVVSDIPGTTRDFVEEYFEYNGKNILLVDTAGIRKKRKMKTSADIFSLFRTDNVLKDADLIFLLVDAMKGPSRESRNIYKKIAESYKPVILVVNKWDLVKGMEMAAYKKRILSEYGFFRNTHIVFISSKTGRNLDLLMKIAFNAWEDYNTVIPTPELNKFLSDVKKLLHPPHPLKLKYITQVGVKPPSFLIFVKNKKYLKDNYKSFLVSQFIKGFNMQTVKVKLIFKEEERK